MRRSFRNACLYSASEPIRQATLLVSSHFIGRIFPLVAFFFESIYPGWMLEIKGPQGWLHSFRLHAEGWRCRIVTGSNLNISNPQQYSYISTLHTSEKLNTPYSHLHTLPHVNTTHMLGFPNTTRCFSTPPPKFAPQSFVPHRTSSLTEERLHDHFKIHAPIAFSPHILTEKKYFFRECGVRVC